ncbi:MAG TPA: glycosyltransferase [Patescibacteria group bacterium]|nr:glycosyltransferase [Patescibacteria group bacterium]
MNNSYFVYTGNAYPHKNLNRLIDAVVKLNVKLKIVSARGVFIDRLNKEIKNKKAEALVELLGFVPDTELNQLYKNSIAFVFPTLSEGFGLPPMEAIEAGALAIVSDIPVLKEVYQDSVFYFDPYNVNSITEALKKAMNLQKSEKDKKVKFAQSFIKRYSWAKMARETLNIYEKEGSPGLR